MSRRALARRLAAVETFPDPEPDLEQYPTPPDLAAHLVHAADLAGDLGGRVLDLGTGTGMLAVAAALRGARVVGVDVDAGPLAVARENARSLDVADRVEWLRADAGRAPLRAAGPGDRTGGDDRADRPTVLANPPFGAQHGSRGDRPFLRTAARVADVSWTVHNAGSRAFVDSLVADNGGHVERAFAAELDVERQFDFHERDRQAVDVEVFRVVWSGDPDRGDAGE